jgi:hypothetical protein
MPVYNSKMLGEVLIDMAWDEHANVFSRLKGSDDKGELNFAAYVENLEKAVNIEAFGRAAAEAERGAFTELGYLTVAGKFGVPRS